jgi:hypothetical protein
MTPGDIVRTPSGRLARYEGGGQYGAEFVYVNEDLQTQMETRDKAVPDSFCVKDIRTILKMELVA